MRIHILTVGEPKLDYARRGWEEYFTRLRRFHQIRATHLPDKKAYDATAVLEAAGKAYKVVLEIEGKQLSSPDLSTFLEKHAQEGRELCFIIGGPDGLPEDVRQAADHQLSLSRLTLPHDLAMVILLEAIYRASTIIVGHPYHR